MAKADRFVTETREDIVQILHYIERAQAIAGRRLQEYNSISQAGKAEIANDYPWETTDMDVSEFIAGMESLENMATILGGGVGSDAEALYKFKIEIG